MLKDHGFKIGCARKKDKPSGSFKVTTLGKCFLISASRIMMDSDNVSQIIAARLRKSHVAKPSLSEVPTKQPKTRVLIMPLACDRPKHNPSQFGWKLA